MQSERRQCFSPLEQERCTIIPTLPELFSVHSSLIQSEHQQFVELRLRQSSTTPLADTVESATQSSVPTSKVVRTNASQLAELLPPNKNPRSTLNGPFQFITVEEEIQEIRDTREEAVPELLPEMSTHDEVNGLIPPQNTEHGSQLKNHSLKATRFSDFEASSESNQSTIRRKESCSCNGMSRASAPLLEGPISHTILSGEFPKLSKSKQAIDILPNLIRSEEEPYGNTATKINKTSFPLEFRDELRLSSQKSSLSLPRSPSLFPPLRIGILVGGETASSGLHNITVGLYHFIKKFCQPSNPVNLPNGSKVLDEANLKLPKSQLFGFPDGPIGLLKGDVVLLGDEAAAIALYLNRGGCEALSYRPLKSLAVHASQLERAVNVLKGLGLDGLVIYAGREDLLAAAKLAEAVERMKCRTRIVAVPHSVGGDIFLADYLPTTLGFDTARRVFTELTGNIATDSVSSKKYYHFLRCGSSLLTLESALQTRPTISIIAEEAHQMKLRLSTIVEKVADIIEFRSKSLEKHSGTILLSYNLIKTLPELQVLLDELTCRLSCPVYYAPTAIDPLNPQPPPGLSLESEALFNLLPKSVRLNLLTSKDHDGRPSLPPINSEVLVAYLVDKELRRRGAYSDNDIGFLYRTHDLCNECHCAMPTDFDCCLGYSLAHVAGALIGGGYNGFVACLQSLDKNVKDWKPSGVPLISFLGVVEETKYEGNSPSISIPGEAIKRHRICVPRRTIDLSSFAVKCYQKYRMSWKINCLYRCPGPIQFKPRVIDVNPDDLPYVLRAHYLPGKIFERLVQSSTDSQNIEQLQRASTERVIDVQRELFGIPDSDIIRKIRKRSITIKAKGQLTPLQLRRLQYTPKLPRLFHETYTIEALDVTARLASNPALLRSVFPLTHNLQALMIVPVGLRMKQAMQLRLDNQRNDVLKGTGGSMGQMQELTKSRNGKLDFSNECASSLHPEQRLQRTISCVSLCGFIGSSSIVRLPVESTATLGCLSTAILPLCVAQSDTNGCHSTQGVSEKRTPNGPFTQQLSRGVSADSKLLHSSTLRDEFNPNGDPAHLAFGGAFSKIPALTLRKTGSVRSTLSVPTLHGQFFQTSVPDLDNSDRSEAKNPTLTWDESKTSTPKKSELSDYSVPSATLSVVNHSSSMSIPRKSPDVIRVFPEEREMPHSTDPQQLDHLLSQAAGASSDSTSLQIKIAVCFLGRPAPGGMNVLWGLTTYLSQLTPPGICYGIVGGLDGLINPNVIEITPQILEMYHNMGGIELLCRTSEYCHNEEDIQACLETVNRLQLHGLIMMGGFATVSTCALLAEAFLQQNCRTSVVAVPVSIESGLPAIETTLGHDTSVRVFNSVIGSIMAECRSSKSWYFLRVSGRNLSNLCVECALETHPTLVLISEEVQEKNMSLVSITNLISDIVEARASKGMMYGVVLLSDSLLDHVPEIRILFDEINSIFQFSYDDNNKHFFNKNHLNGITKATLEGSYTRKSGRFWPRNEEGLSLLRSRLTPWSAALFSSLPHKIQWQFAFSKDYTDKVDLGNVDTEVLLKTLVQTELSRRKSLGSFRQKGASFNCKTHFLAYQGRSALPTNFDCDLGFSLGYSAAVLVDGGKTGYLTTLSNLHLPAEKWTAEAVPLASLIDIKPVQQPRQQQMSCEFHEIDVSDNRQPLSQQNQLSDLHFSLNVPALRCSLESEAYQLIQARKLTWMFSDCFCSPGPVQFRDEHDHDGFSQCLYSLRLSPGVNPFNPTTQLKEISRLCSEIKLLSGQHAFSSVTAVAATSLKGLLDVLKTLAASRTCRQGISRNQTSNIFDAHVTHKDLIGLSFLERYLTTTIYHPELNTIASAMDTVAQSFCNFP